MKTINKIILSVVIVSSVLFGQGYQGPASGKVTGGITLSTDNFSIAGVPETFYPSSRGKKISDEVNFFFSEEELNLGMFEEQLNHKKKPRINAVSFAEELSFEGPNSPGCWVPDCNITPGPSDVLIVTNTAFWITDRSGNPIKKISSSDWYSQFIGSGLIFDPKSFYDTRTKRFYMIYLYRDSSIDESLLLVSVSDDSTAEGSWNNWVIRGDFNGSDEVEQYMDFPSMIVTNDALYIAVDMFPHTGGNPVYSKLRAFPISDLTQSTPGELNYTDLWDFRNPKFPNSILRTLKLVHDYDETGNAYLTGFNVNTATQNYIGVYEISDIFGSASVNSVSVDTSPFRLTPHMQQKGGSIPVQLFHLFYSEMFRRNGKIYIVHSIRDGSYASIHYMQVNTNTWVLDDELIIGNEGYFYGYVDLIVDENDNAYMVYQRSSADEYAGVFYSAKSPNSDSFGEDIPLMEGSGNMANNGCGATFGYVRFGDYVDVMFDPVEKDKIWLMGQYVASNNNWKTRIAKVSMDEIVSVDNNDLDKKFMLSQNYPNPFNPSTKISFSLPKKSNVSLKVFNSLGQEVSTLIEEIVAAGNHTFEFNAENLPSGVYFYELRSENLIESKKMVLLK